MSDDDSTAALLRAITDNLQDKGNGWRACAVILEPRDSAYPVAGTETFLYGAEGYLGTGRVKPLPLGPAVRAYMDDHYAAGQTWPIKLLVQYDRVADRHRILVEKSDPARWLMTPASIQEIREELRPRF